MHMKPDIQNSKKFLAFIPFLFLWAGCSLDLGYSPDSFGTITLVSVPDKADVYFDKTFIGNTPLETLRIKKGKHLLRIEKKHYVPWEKKINIFPYNEHKVFVELETKTSEPDPDSKTDQDKK